VIFTKFDSLEAKAFYNLKSKGQTRKEARKNAPKHANEEFEKVHLPRIFGTLLPNYVCLRNMHKDHGAPEICQKMAELIQKTADSLDTDALKALLALVQQRNLELTIEYAVNYAPIQRITNELLASSVPITWEELTNLIDNLSMWFQYLQNDGNPEMPPSLNSWDWDNPDTPADPLPGLPLDQTDNSDDPTNFLNSTRLSLQRVLYPRLMTLAGPLPIKLQVLNLTAALLIVIARSFWLTSGAQVASGILCISLENYFKEGAADAVRMAILGKFGDYTGHFTPQRASALVQIILDQLGMLDML